MILTEGKIEEVRHSNTDTWHDTLELKHMIIPIILENKHLERKLRENWKIMIRKTEKRSKNKTGRNYEKLNRLVVLFGWLIDCFSGAPVWYR